MRPTPRKWFVTLAPVAMLVLVGAPSRATTVGRPPWVQGAARPSRAGEQMLRDRFARGEYVDPAVVRRWALDRELDEAETVVLAPADIFARRPTPSRALGASLGNDSPASNPAGDVSCAACAGRPLSQAETTIAAHQNHVIAGWNDGRGFCVTTSPVQGWAISNDGGVTFTDQGDVPGLADGGRYRGDPVHFVNRKTGRFYILGLYERTPATGSGLAMLGGAFAGNTFTTAFNRQIKVGGSNFLDKEWGAVDSLSGNVYVTYSNFVGGTTPQIEFMRFNANGDSTGFQLMHDVGQNGNVQGSRVVVGPGGVVYVTWYEFGLPQSSLHIRRSNDFGSSFGPDVTLATFYENSLSGGPGYRRGFAPSFPSIAIDESTGPHRGRVYVTWDESVNFYDAPAPNLGSKSEVEQNATFANATPFTVGQTLRGALASPDTLDLWRFTGNRGQTVYVRCDSSTAAANTPFNLRLQCDQDTSTFVNFRLLTLSTAVNPAFAFTLPRTGTYFMRMQRGSAAAAGYRLLTSFDTPSPGERARDHRDQFLSFSDDGTIWSAPQRLTDGDPWFDGIFPEVATDAGRVHVFWHDWRDDLVCGAVSNEFLTSSANGGVTFGANRRISDAPSYWSINACGSANQGDYQGITALGAAVHPCWADTRAGDVDAWTEALRIQLDAACGASPRTVIGGSPIAIPFTIDNQGSAKSDFAFQVTDTDGWITGATPGLLGTVTVAAGAQRVVQVSLTPPANCGDGTDNVTLRIEDAFVPGLSDQCTVRLDCGVLDAPGGVPRTVRLARPQPNPSSGRVQLTYALPRSTRVRLSVHGADGRLVRTLVDGDRDPGTHVVLWDGRSRTGQRAAPGAYYVRFMAEGQTFHQPVTLVR